MATADAAISRPVYEFLELARIVETDPNPSPTSRMASLFVRESSRNGMR